MTFESSLQAILSPISSVPTSWMAITERECQRKAYCSGDHGDGRGKITLKLQTEDDRTPWPKSAFATISNLSW